MKYRLRHFENNNQIISSLGWVLIVIGIINAFISTIPIAVVFIFLGVFLVWLQLRGKRIIINTETRKVKSGRNIVTLSNPSLIFVNEVRLAQNVNSRVSSSRVKMYFYKAFIQDGESKILLSCNRNDQRDMEAIKKIAEDLGVPLQLNYN